MAKSGYFFRVSQLDPHAEKLNKIIQNLIKQNIFSRVVRDAIRLYADLNEGHTEVLEELFPFVRTHYCNENNSDRMQKYIDEAVRKAMLEQGRALPDTRDHGIPAAKPYGHSAIAAPVATITAAKPLDASEIVDNFMAFLQ